MPESDYEKQIIDWQRSERGREATRNRLKDLDSRIDFYKSIGRNDWADDYQRVKREIYARVIAGGIPLYGPMPDKPEQPSRSGPHGELMSLDVGPDNFAGSYEPGPEGPWRTEGPDLSKAVGSVPGPSANSDPPVGKTRLTPRVSLDSRVGDGITSGIKKMWKKFTSRKNH